MTDEDDIVHETAIGHVLRCPTQYTVYLHGLTHATADSSYPRNSDGRSIAIARLDYLTRSLQRGA